MIMRQIIPAVLVLFSTFTIWVLVFEPEPFWAWFMGLTTHTATLQVVLDLSIALLLLWYFIYQDHNGRGGAVGPFVLFFLLTPGVGVIAPLLFLTLRTFRPDWFFPWIQVISAAPPVSRAPEYSPQNISAGV